MDFKNWLFLTEAFELPYSAYKEIVDWLLGVASKKRFEYESKTFKLDLTGTRFSFLHDNKNNPDIKDEIDIVVEAYVRNKDTKNSGSYSVSSFRANKLSDDQLWIQSKIKIYLSNKKFYYDGPQGKIELQNTVHHEILHYLQDIINYKKNTKYGGLTKKKILASQLRVNKALYKLSSGDDTLSTHKLPHSIRPAEAQTNLASDLYEIRYRYLESSLRELIKKLEKINDPLRDKEKIKELLLKQANDLVNDKEVKKRFFDYYQFDWPELKKPENYKLKRWYLSKIYNRFVEDNTWLTQNYIDIINSIYDRMQELKLKTKQLDMGELPEFLKSNKTDKVVFTAGMDDFNSCIIDEDKKQKFIDLAIFHDERMEYGFNLKTVDLVFKRILEEKNKSDDPNFYDCVAKRLSELLSDGVAKIYKYSDTLNSQEIADIILNVYYKM